MQFLVFKSTNECPNIIVALKSYKYFDKLYCTVTRGGIYNKI